MTQDVQGLWTALIILSSASGTGFIFLLIRVLFNTQKLSETPSYKYLNDEFYRKEMIDTHLKNIDKELLFQSTSINQMVIKIDKVFMRYLKDWEDK